MKVFGLSTDAVTHVVGVVSNQRYEDNVYAADVKDASIRTQERATFVVRCHASDGAGARRSASGRRLVAGSWEAYRDVIQALFDFGAVRVVTRLADYRPDTFADQYPDTYFTKMGSMFAPAYLGDL